MSQTQTENTYGFRNLVFDDFLPTALEFYRVGHNPNTNQTTEQQTHVYENAPGVTRTDDPNAGILYGVKFSRTQWGMLAVAAALAAYLVVK